MDPQTLYDVFPGLDCGACGAATCNAFARGILAGKSTPDDCPTLRSPEYADRRARLSAELLETLQATCEGRATAESMGGVTYIRPCAEDIAKVTAETRLQRRFTVPPPLRFEVFDPSTWDWMLQSIELFGNARCSESLGVARIEACGMTVMVLRDGRVNVRAAPDEEQAMAVIHLVSRALWGSVICHCGNISMDCAGGACTECLDAACPASDTEPFTFTSTTTRSQADQDIRGASLPSGPAGDPLRALGNSVDQAARMLEDMAARLICGLANGYTREDLGKMLSDARRKAVQMLVRAPEGRHARSALTAMGALMDLQRVSDGLDLATHTEQTITGASMALLTEAFQVFALSLKGLRSGQPADVTAAQERFDAFRDAWMIEFGNLGNTRTLSAFYKIASNGLYLSRLRSSTRAEALEWLGHQSDRLSSSRE